MALTITYYPLGDSALVANFGDIISTVINSAIRQLTSELSNKNINGLSEVVPGYSTLTVYYDLRLISFEDLISELEILKNELPIVTNSEKVLKTIPVWYNGPDLDYVSHYTGLHKEDVIKIHSEKEYLVYMIGFAPGFPYLGGMDKRIATPRKENPRLKIEEGSVGIAAEQTGVYPIATPGGWQLIGTTPLRLFDIKKDKPSFLEVGDYVHFVSITEKDFYDLKENEYGD